MFVQWDEATHSLGIDEIDRQHQELFLITNELFEEGQKERAQAKLIPLFKRLADKGLFEGFPGESEPLPG